MVALGAHILKGAGGTKILHDTYRLEVSAVEQLLLAATKNA